MRIENCFILDTVDQTLTSRDESHSGSITARSLMLSPQVVSDSQPEQAEIRVRGYQAELIHDAKTENSIVVAPTGSGKTLVAAELTRHHMTSSVFPRDYTAIFIVDKVPLVLQQAEKLLEYLKPTLDWFKVDQLIGEKSAQLGVSMSENQAVVLTAQVLVNHLKGKGDCKTISLTSIDLLIFDECHHTHDNHPYNEIMNFYHDLKQRHPRGKLPKIIGLTASIGTGGKMTPEGALQHVYKICANLDCKRIVRVKENKAELAAHVTPPEANVQVVPSRRVDPFRTRVVDFMQALEREYFEKRPPSQCQHGTQQYESWIQSMRSLMLQTSNREGEFCARCLIELSRALVVNDDCRTVDARTYFQRFLNEILRLKFEGGKALLRGRLSKFVEDLIDLEKTPEALVNPKLVYLEQLLLRRYADEPDSLCILFTKTRYSTQAFTKWINFNPRLCHLNATRLTGSSNDEDSMTKPQQQEVIDDFSKGISKIMIATTIAIQGLDIKACNTVIRYGLVTDEIAMVQARGRARAAASKVTAVHPSYRGEQKERANEEKEELMEDALHEFEKIDPQIVAETTASLQADSFRQREMVRAQEQQIDRGCRYDMTRIEFFCKECQSFLCRGDSIQKLVKTHTIVTDDAFKDNAEWSLLPPKTGSPASYDGVDIGGRVVCKKCNKRIGAVVSKEKVSFPALSMKEVLWSHRGSSQKKETVGKATKKEFDKGFRDY